MKIDVCNSFWKRPKSTTGTRLESMVTSTGSVTTTGTLGRAPRRGHRRGFGGPVLRAKSNDFLDNMVDVSYASTLMTSTLSQSSLVTKMTRVSDKNYIRGILERNLFHSSVFTNLRQGDLDLSIFRPMKTSVFNKHTIKVCAGCS